MAAPRVRKVAVVGSRAVGKSSLTLQYVEDHFVDSYYPTIENQFNKTIRYKGRDYSIDILDTAGQDEFSIINQKHVIGVHGYLLVYSVTSRSSFDMIRIVYDKILNNMGVDKVPVVIVGNKSDLHIQRQVPEEDGRALAKELQCGFVETSARHNENIARAFDLLIAEMERQTDPPPAEPSSCIVS